jgi:CarD family transcriptional regulator
VLVVKTQGKVHRLTVGSRVFYPAHGVASVTGMEERDFGDEKQVFYVLELDRGVKLLLPPEKVDQAGVRDLVSPSKARELMKRVKEEPRQGELKVDPTSRKVRAASYSEALRSGSADRYTEILQELLFRSRSSKLSNSDQHALEIALGYFVGEVGAALEQSPEEVEADLRGAPAAG